MKAELSRQKLYEVCAMNDRDRKLINNELEELERLADIGRATEKVMIDGMILTNPVYNGSGICEGVGDTLANVQELLEWAKGE